MSDRKQRVLVDLDESQAAQIKAFIGRQPIPPSMTAVLRAIVARGLPLVVSDGPPATITVEVST